MNKLNKFNVIISIVLVIMMVIGVSQLNMVGATEAVKIGEESLKTITANGSAAIKVAPDVAYLNVGVISEDIELHVAQENANKNMDAVIKELKILGINEKDIKTVNFNVSQKYDWSEDGKRNVVGYIVNNIVDVTINDLSKIGTVIDGVTLKGSNVISNLRFGLKDETTLYNQALELAVKDAKAKAEAMGKGINKANLEPVKITETSYKNTNLISRDTNSMDMVAEIGTPINTGEINVNASVSVDFSFK